MCDLWIKPRSGNPTIRTEPYRAEEITYLGEISDWYRIFRLAGNVIAISEPYHAQGVFSYLILGTKKAVLFDTGLGMCDIRPVIELYVPEGLPLMVVNSHTHFDHIGNNWRFDKVWIYDDPVAKNIAKNGYTREALAGETEDRCFYGKKPEGFSAENYHIRPFACELLHDGDILDLGNRTLRVIHTPGHSPDGIMLYDFLNRLLFTGDTYYAGADCICLKAGNRSIRISALCVC